MSVHVTSWVFKHSEAKLGARLVLLTLADHASADGTETYPALDTIAREARLSRNTARAALKRLERDGMVKRDGIGPQGQAKWRVIMEIQGVQNVYPPQTREGQNELSEGVNLDTPPRVQETGPEPSIEPTTNQQKQENARERAATNGRLRYRGAPVAKEVSDAAQAVLAHYRQKTGQDVWTLKGDGTPSESLKRILGAMLSYPGTPVVKWCDTIDGVLDSPPWWTGPPSVGVIFGPRVVEENLVNPRRGVAQNGHANGNGLYTNKGTEALRGLHNLIQTERANGAMA